MYLCGHGEKAEGDGYKADFAMSHESDFADVAMYIHT